MTHYFNWHPEAQHSVTQRGAVVIWALLCVLVIGAWFWKELHR